jgi:hypothetical protein
VIGGIPLERLLDRRLDEADLDHSARGLVLASERGPSEAERAHEQQAGGGDDGRGAAPPQGDQRRQRRVHEHDQEGHAVDAGQLGDLDHRQHGVLRIAEEPPGKAAHQVPAQPLPRHPQRRHEAERGSGADPVSQPGHGRRGQRHVEATVRGERGDG